MDTLHHLAQAAAVVLLAELLIGLLLFLGIAGGMAFGLHWGRGKTDWVFGKVNAALPKIAQMVHRGTDYAAAPVIVTGSLAERVLATVGALQQRVRTARAMRSVSQPPPSGAGRSPAPPSVHSADPENEPIVQL